jgi:hypothetical protein
MEGDFFLGRSHLEVVCLVGCSSANPILPRPTQVYFLLLFLFPDFWGQTFKLSSEKQIFFFCSLMIMLVLTIFII